MSKADDSLEKLADEETDAQKENEKALEPFVERVKPYWVSVSKMCV